MRKRLGLLLTAVAVSIASPALAQDIPPPPGGGPSAGELMNQCLAGISQGNVTNPVCTGYLAGFVGAVRIGQSVSADFPICLPEHGLSNTDIVASVTSYLSTNPSALSNSARSVFFLVLTNLYPCRIAP